MDNISFIDPSIMTRSFVCYAMNPFCRYLINLFGEKEAMRLIRLYHIGTSSKRGGSTVFWLVDACQNVRTGKVVAYNVEEEQGIKEVANHVSWAHDELHLQGFNSKPCLYGEHLLPFFPSRMIMLVKSEKTAVIASHFMPDYLWLATGGGDECFNEDCLQSLRGRRVTIFPKLGNISSWQERTLLLQGICASFSVSTVLEEQATDKQRTQGLDIADFLLMTDTKQMMLAKMIRRYPALKLLIDKLGLELVEDD